MVTRHKFKTAIMRIDKTNICLNPAQQVIGDAKGVVTSTGIFPVTGCRSAIFSSRRHVSFRFSSTRLDFSCSFLKSVMQDLYIGSSISVNILETFIVKLTTALFQCVWMFCSRAGTTIGNISGRFRVIRLTMCSLFHRTRALSATCINKTRHCKAVKHRLQINCENIPHHETNKYVKIIKNHHSLLGYTVHASFVVLSCFMV